MQIFEQTTPPEATTPSRPRVQNDRGHGMRRLLVCLDRSALSELCLPSAVFIAKTFGSRMTLLHVMQPPHERSAIHATDALGWEISHQEATAYLERFGNQATRESGRDVDVRLEQGHPGERIPAVARELGADLTILGSHGESGVTSWNLGSTAQQVLALADSSVLVARGPTSPAASFSPQRILVPLDGSPRTESALPTAMRMAKETGADLLLVHIVPEPVPTAVRAAEDLELARELATRMETRAKRYLGQIRDQLARELPNVRTIVLRHADLAQCLLEVAKRERIDLIVLSAHGSTCNRERSFGSVTTHLVAFSSVSLLVLQDLSESEVQRAPNGVDGAPPPRSNSPKGTV